MKLFMKDPGTKRTNDRSVKLFSRVHFIWLTPLISIINTFYKIGIFNLINQLSVSSFPPHRKTDGCHRLKKKNLTNWANQMTNVDFKQTTNMLWVLCMVSPSKYRELFSELFSFIVSQLKSWVNLVGIVLMWFFAF